MIEISLGKMVLLALIALIVLGPEKLPGAARTAGALLRRVRSGWDNVRAEVERELAIEEIKRSAREAVAGAEAAQKQVRETLKQAHDPFAEAAAMVRLQPGSAAAPADPLPSDELPAEPLLTGQVPVASLDESPTHDSATDAGAGQPGAAPAHGPQPEGSATSPGETTSDSPQAELPLDTPPVVPVPRKDGLHGDA